MANILSLQFSNTIDQNISKFSYNGTTDNSDFTHFIGTNQGNNNYSNLFDSGEITSSTSSAAVWDRSTSEQISGGVYKFKFTNYIANISQVNLAIANFNNNGTTIFLLQALNSNNGWETVASILSTGFSIVYRKGIQLDSAPKFFSDTFRVVFSSGPSENFQLGDIRLWGVLKRKDGGSLGLRPIPTTTSDLADSFVPVISNSILSYKGTLIEKEDILYPTTRITLTGDYQIPSTFEHTIFNIDPDGNSRNVYLPKYPELDSYLRITNTEGVNSLIIKENSSSSDILTLSNSEGTNTAEFWWEAEDSTWHVVS